MLFVAGNLDDRTVKTFRTQKYYPFEDDNTEYDGLKIIPIDIDILKVIISKNITYSDLYLIFDNAYNSEIRTMEWYEDKIKRGIISYE